MTAVRVPDGAVLLAGQDLVWAAMCVSQAIAGRRRAGVPTPGGLEQLASVLGRGGPQPDEPARPGGHAEHVELIGTADAARILGLTERQVRRLAPRLDGDKVSGRWLVSRLAVSEHLTGRDPQ